MRSRDCCISVANRRSLASVSVILLCVGGRSQQGDREQASQQEGDREQDDEPDLEPRYESVQRAEQSGPQQEDSKVKDHQYVGQVGRLVGR